MNTTQVVDNLGLSFAEHSEPGDEIIKRPIRMELWGQDHWSTFAYLETCVVDNKGIPNLDRMRCDFDRHPGLYGTLRRNQSLKEKKYPTRLKNAVEVLNHDDWDCVDDMEAAGLLRWEGTGIHPIIVFTERGNQIAAELRQHKAKGGKWGSFHPAMV